MSWLKRLDLPRTVPQRTAKRLARVTSIEAAQTFIQAAGLKIVTETETRQETETVSGVSLVKPEGHLDYYSPQIAFPKFASPLIPFGTVLFNCLLPKTQSLAEGQQLFNQAKASLLQLSIALEASPFACITGFKTSKAATHDLSLRGFRFFFSPLPNKLFNRIELLLRSFTLISQMPDGVELVNDKPKVEEKLRLISELEQLRTTLTDNGPIGHTILNDVRPMAEQTVLVDLR